MSETSGSADLNAVTARGKELVDRLAVSARFAGSEPERAARRLCGELLKDSGFQVSEDGFTFSEFPARCVPSISASLLALAALIAHLASGHERPVVGLLVAIGSAALVGLIGRFMLGRGIMHLPWMRSQSVNLVARRATAPAEPKVWLVAHLDSKSQTIPMLARVGAVATGVVAFALLVVTLLIQASGVFVGVVNAAGVFKSVSGLAAITFVVAMAPLIVCFIGNRSRGALDNATGVASVLIAAEMIDQRVNVGVLLTSGEELGLAGARAFASARSSAVALNCDTVDDAGSFICMTTGRGRRGRQTAEAVHSAARRLALSVTVRGMIPGILADNVALSQAGWSSCTLSRGNLATLARVHTNGDAPDSIEGTGIASAARILAATAGEFS